MSETTAAPVGAATATAASEGVRVARKGDHKGLAFARHFTTEGVPGR